jgi:NADH-quinone oxidoreductase subunit H
MLLYTGWGSNSNWGRIGAVRGVAQIIAYEVSLTFIILPSIMLGGSFSLITIRERQIEVPNIVPLLPMGILFIISAIAETSRAPFDLTEAESEIVAGVLTEYGGIKFALLYLAEYTYILSMGVIGGILFLGGGEWAPIIIIIYI